MNKKTIAISGVSGFIGGELALYFLKNDFNVIGLSRCKPDISHPNFSFLHYDLVNFCEFHVLSKADAIIHCAFMKRTPAQNNSDEINIQATMLLADYCRIEKKKFIFLSSFSAHENANSHYGKHKFYLEAQLRDHHVVIKPGLVKGKKGLYAELDKLIETRKIIPIIGDGSQIFQCIEIENLNKAIYNALIKDLKGIFPVAHVKGKTFLQLLEEIALNKNKSPFFIFIPVFFAALLIKVFKDKLPFNEENLKGLIQVQQIDTSVSLKDLGLEI
jgi:nucleoside-diphosphate-sugar epimerase